MRRELEQAHKYAAEAIGQLSHMIVKQKATKRQILDVIGKLDSAGLELKKASCGGAEER